MFCGNSVASIQNVAVNHKTKRKNTMCDITYDFQYGNIIITNDTVLSILTFTASTIGIALSIISLLLLVVTAILFSEWRQNYKNKLLIQFMLARFLYSLARYLYDVTKLFHVYLLPNFFKDLDMLILFYTEMALMAWMVVFTKHMYDCFVKLFNVEQPRVLKVSLAAWLTPLLCSTVFFILYVFTNNTLLLYGLYLTLLKFPIIIVIAVWLIRTLKSIINVNQSRTENNLRIIMVMIVLIFFFCIQQIVIDVYKLVVTIIVHVMKEMPNILKPALIFFNIAALYHCAIAILFWLFGNTRTRKLWKCKGKNEEQAKSSDVQISIK